MQFDAATLPGRYATFGQLLTFIIKLRYILQPLRPPSHFHIGGRKVFAISLDILIAFSHEAIGAALPVRRL